MERPMILHFGHLIGIFSLNENIQFVTDTYDPTVAGLTGPIGSFYSRSTNGDFFKKTGAGDTDWELIFSAGDIEGASVGSGAAVYKEKTGATLQFRSLSNATDGNMTISLDGDNILLKSNKYPAAPNIVYVDSSLAANQPGLIYKTIAEAVTYAASQTPTADSPWQIEVYSSIDASAFVLPDYVHITSKGPISCKLTGAFTFTGTVTPHTNWDRLSFLSSINGFIILGMNLTGAGTGALLFENCWFPAGKTYAGTPVAANGLKVGSGFNGWVVTKHCHISKVDVTTGGNANDSIRGILHYNDRFLTNVSPASSFGYSGTTAQFFSVHFLGLTGLAFGTTPASVYASSKFLTCVFETGGVDFNFSGSADIKSGGSIFDSSGGSFTTTGLTGVLEEWGGGSGGGGSGGLTTTAVKTATYTAANLERVAADTSGGPFPVELPATPAHGTEVEILDVGGAFSTNNLTVERNGQNINGIAANVLLNVDNSLSKFVYVASYGWRFI